MLDVKELKWNEQGLIPAIVQDAATEGVLMLAWMNADSLALTMAEGRVWFYSRSRGRLWRKGETSGNTLTLVSMTADCDCDALLLRVTPAGPACHTGAVSCFHQAMVGGQGFSIDELYTLIQSRRAQRPDGAYTTYLFEQGLDKILKKVGEEAAEVIIAAKNPNKPPLVGELADLVYHALVLMAQREVSPAAVRRELAERHAGGTPT